MASLEHKTEPDRAWATELELRCAIADAYRALGQRSMNHASTGNISCRHEDRILITPSGIDYDAITADSIVAINWRGEVEGRYIPSCEWQMHLEIYRVQPEAGAVVHTHSDACVALSCLRRPIPAFHYMVAAFGGNDIPCAPYAPFGSHELACYATRALASRTACLLANHGMVCHGPILATAISTAIKLETLARQYLMALQAGIPILLTEAQVSAAQEQLEEYCAAADAQCSVPSEIPHRAGRPAH
jgi:L-fuculose-phosphate aldolase